MVEFEGGTYSSQFEADELRAAIYQYNQSDPSGCGAVPLDMDAVELAGLKNIYCASGLTIMHKRFIMANIVKTDVSK